MSYQNLLEQNYAAISSSQYSDKHDHEASNELESILSEPDVSPWQRYKSATWIEMKMLVFLAAPAVAVYMINYLMSMSTQIFCGHLGNLELAAASLGNTGIQVFAYGLMFTGSNSGVIEALQLVMNQNYESGDYEECLKISEELVSAQPENPKWKISMAKVLKQMGESKKALDVLDEVLSKNPLEPHALFESSVWMSLDGQEEEATIRLEKALQIATKKNKSTELRDVRLVICQVKFLQKKVDEALRGFHELEKEDPTDVRIYFCKGLLFYCTERNAEATEQFDKYYELLPNATQSDEGYMTTYPKMRPRGI